MSYLDEIYQNPGRTVQLFLPEGQSDALKIATLHGWAGSVMVANNSALRKLLNREEAKRTGLYILYGPDPDDGLKSRVYIGEADDITSRLPNSATEREFWEIVVVITANDESLTKSHVRFLEAMLIQIGQEANRATLENVQKPAPDGIHLTEADKANMYDFLRNIHMILPVVGLDFLKPAVTVDRSDTNETGDTSGTGPPAPNANFPRFELPHKGKILAQMIEKDGEYIVLEGSLARKFSDRKDKQYGGLKQELIKAAKLVEHGDFYQFSQDVAFKSLSAAAAIVMDGAANGRYWWKVKGTKTTYNEWQLSQQHEAETAA